MQSWTECLYCWTKSLLPTPLVTQVHLYKLWLRLSLSLSLYLKHIWQLEKILAFIHHFFLSNGGRGVWLFIRSFSGYWLKLNSRIGLQRSLLRQDVKASNHIYVSDVPRESSQHSQSSRVIPDRLNVGIMQSTSLKDRKQQHETMKPEIRERCAFVRPIC